MDQAAFLHEELHTKLTLIFYTGGPHSKFNFHKEAFWLYYNMEACSILYILGLYII